MWIKAVVIGAIIIIIIIIIIILLPLLSATTTTTTTTTSYYHPGRKRKAGALERSPCIFTNINELGSSLASCSSHGVKDSSGDYSTCTVRGSTLHISGFSCKTLSKLQNDRAAGRTSLRDKSGSPGAMLQGLSDFLSSHRVGILVLENVDDILSSSSPNYESLLEELEQWQFIAAGRRYHYRITTHRDANVRI